MDDQSKMTIYEGKKLSKGTMWVLFLFLGWSYGSMDKMGLQILYWVTGAGCGIWGLIRLFMLNNAINNYNRGIARKLGIDEVTIATL